MTQTPIKFGTDGWRAIIAEDYTFENVRDCAEGVARYLKDTGLASRGLVIGFDTRFGSEHFAAASAEGEVVDVVHSDGRSLALHRALHICSHRHSAERRRLLVGI